MSRRRARLVAIGLLLSAGRLLGQSADIGPPPGRIVEVEGGKIHVVCTGAGDPTVVLEAGASSFAIDWSLVQSDIARTNRVCSYDRFGHGWSEGNTGTSARIVQTLHAVLQTAGEKPPFVMVGASAGGLYVRLYQVRYPGDVVAIVQVDPAHEDRLFTFFNGEAVAIASLTSEQLRSTLQPGSVQMPTRPPQTGTPFDRLPPDLDKVRVALDRTLIASTPRLMSYDDRLLRAEGERATLAELAALTAARTHPLGEMPVIVLSRGLDSSQGARDVHASMARLSTNFRHTVVAAAGHEIHLFEPTAVVEAIHDAVTAVKNKTRLRQQID